MLTRIDLAKQFELITKQEVKNYQDSYNNVLQSIRDLKDEIKHVNDSSLENHAFLHSQQHHSARLIENLCIAFEESCQSMERFINDQKVMNERFQEQILAAEDSARANTARQKDLLKWLCEVKDRCQSIESKTATNFKIVDGLFGDLLIKFRKEIVESTKEILHAPTEELQRVKTHLEEKISEHKVDVAGIMRELLVYKKDSVITQKKIENLYTLVKRLQGEK